MAAFLLGGTYRKMDLQMHSPRDHKYKDNSVLGLGPSSAPDQVMEARRKWAVRFVDCCIKCGLSAVALTDHHDWEFSRVVQEEIQQRKAKASDFDLILYPGLEVTCEDSAQCILLFDATVPYELLDRVRSKLNLPHDCQPLDFKHPKVGVLHVKIEKLQELLAEDGALKDRFIILPNITPSGHKTILRTGFQHRYAKLPQVGGYMDAVDACALKPRELAILSGKDPEWGSRRMAFVNTSDARSFDEIGSYCTWVKVGDNSAEALRQAFLAPESRLSLTTPQLPYAWITKIVVKNATVLSDSAEYLNPQMVALIGGRGSGKSSLLEYLRFGLGASGADLGQQEEISRAQRFLEYTLNHTDAAISIEVNIGGSKSTFTRRGANPRVILQEINGSTLELTAEDVRTIFPCQAYSQGELSKIGETGAGDNVKRLLLSPHDHEISKDRGTLFELKLKRKAFFEQLVIMWGLKVTLRQEVSQLTNLREQRSSTQLELCSAPQEHTVLGDTYLSVRTVCSKMGQMIQGYKATSAWLKQWPQGGHIDLSVELEKLKDIEDLKDAIELVRALTQGSDQSLASQVESLHTMVQDLISQLETKMCEFRKIEETLGLSVKEAAAATSEFQQSIAKRTELDGLILAAKQRVEELDNKIREELSLQVGFEDASRLLMSLLSEQRALLEQAASQFGQLSNGLAQARVVVGGNTKEASLALQRLVQGSHVRQDKIEAMVNFVLGGVDPHDTWRQVQDECVLYLKWMVLGQRPDDKPALPILSAYLPPSAFTRFDYDRVGDIISAFLEDSVELSYIRGREDVPFHAASPGEQATALLAVLLNQPGGPLLLDQPEDDLDNGVVSEVVKRLRTAKRHRQIIMATHNANLVVNGDAEQVLYFEPISVNDTKGCLVKHGGAIDIKEIKDAITDTMEGGKPAFELRRSKYRF
ncbi:MAG: AAA family ATPase [Peptococcaceae bacterium]|nr:AAA family ATPase [Peptococcaceae bacterium]